MNARNVLSKLATSGIYLFIIAVTIYAIVSPYSKTNILGSEYIWYIDKLCDADVCEPIPNNFVHLSRALYALFIIQIVLAGLCILFCLLNASTLNNICGLLLLLIAIAIMVTLIITIKTVYHQITYFWTGKTDKFYYDFTTSSILLVTGCSLAILTQLLSNGFIRAFFSKLFRLITGKH